MKAKILRVEWDEQFFNKDGKTVREDSYTPELMASGKCDVYPTGLTKLPWREKKLAFVTLYPTRMMVMVNKSRKEEFKTPRDLCAKTASTVKDTSWHTWLQAQNETTCAANPIRIKLSALRRRPGRSIQATLISRSPISTIRWGREAPTRTPSPLSL